MPLREARKLANQVARAARHVTEAAKRPENHQRAKMVAKYLRQRTGR